MLKLRYYVDKVSRIVMGSSLISLLTVIPLLFLTDEYRYGKVSEISGLIYSWTLWALGISFLVGYITDILTKNHLDNILSTGKYCVIHRDIEEEYCLMYDKETKYVYHWNPSKDSWLEPMISKDGTPFKCTKKYLKTWGK